MTLVCMVLSRAVSSTILLAAESTPAEDLPKPGFVVSLLNTISDWLRATFGPPLKTIQQPIDEWLGTVDMSVAMICCLGLFGIALCWVWTLNKEFILKGAPDNAWWRDLRIWATLVLVPYITAYYFLGR